MTSSAEAQMVRKRFADRMKEFITHEGIYQSLLPDFAVGCRRLTPVGGELVASHSATN